jgi:predicted metal-binding membrane protein
MHPFRLSNFLALAGLLMAAWAVAAQTAQSPVPANSAPGTVAVQDLSAGRVGSLEVPLRVAAK